MAVYDLEEQEQLEALKSWWKTHGNLITYAVLAVVLVFAAWQGYRYWQQSKSANAAQAYAQLDKAARAKDGKKVRDSAALIMKEFPNSGVAGMAALMGAKAAFDANDLKSAREQLQWAADKSRDETLRATARLRLAGVLLDEKSYDDALKQLASGFPESFAGLVADLRGDVLTAQGKLTDARAAYKLA
ncbi:MAG: tetratricopeptide repeat protein, partial [Betaproteobacteria bacterium]|nr:tetratricopeptide repeat protein [Betaproteobacteria bacterium]